VLEFRKIARAQQLPFIVVPTLGDLVLAKESAAFLARSLTPTRSRAQVAP